MEAESGGITGPFVDVTQAAARLWVVGMHDLVTASGQRPAELSLERMAGVVVNEDAHEPRLRRR